MISLLSWGEGRVVQFWTPAPKDVGQEMRWYNDRKKNTLFICPNLPLIANIISYCLDGVRKVPP